MRQEGASSGALVGSHRRIPQPSPDIITRRCLSLSASAPATSFLVLCSMPSHLATMLFPMSGKSCITFADDLQCQETSVVAFLESVAVASLYLVDAVGKNHHRITPIGQQLCTFFARDHGLRVSGMIVRAAFVRPRLWCHP